MRYVSLTTGNGAGCLRNNPPGRLIPVRAIVRNVSHHHKLITGITGCTTFLCSLRIPGSLRLTLH